MKAVIFAGGVGSRLRPFLAQGVNKHLVPIYDRPLIHHVLYTLKQAGVQDVIISLNGRNPGLLLECVGNGSEFDMHICFTYDDRPMSVGPGANLIDVEQWVGNDHFLLMLGDSMYFEPLKIPRVISPDHAYVWTTRINSDWDDYRKYAQVATAKDIVTRLDRSDSFFSPVIQTGAWIVPPDVFSKVRTILSTQEERELRITDIMRLYVAEKRLRAIPLPTKAFIDCGTPQAIAKAVERLAEKTYARLGAMS